MPERDQWGETTEERQARIMARDLAWMVCSTAHASDGVPCDPSAHLHFNEGWAAAYAEFHHTNGSTT